MVSLPGRRARGFTIPELMAGLAILGVMAAIATPSLGSMVDGQRVRSASSDVFTSLLRARSEAIRRNTEITITPVSAGHWEDGWTIPDPANSAAFFERHNAIVKASITGPASVVYLSNGRVKGSSAPSFEISVSGVATKRCVQVDLSGRPVQKNTGC